MDMLSHYSKCHDKVFSRDHPVPCDNEHKPGGLWLSDDSDYGWFDFVSERLQSGSSDWADGNELLRFRYDFILNPGQVNRILVLRTPEDMRKFTSKYREAYPRLCVVDGELGFGVHIEWSRVKANFKGILITPYQAGLSHRKGDLDYHWYRFDCASGCFWDISCLTMVRGAPSRALVGETRSLTTLWRK